MGTKTGIEWTDSTWSPIRVRVKSDAAEIAKAKGYSSLVEIAGKMAGHVGQHCEHVSPGCEHCYAESNNHRCLPANGTGLPYDRRSRDLVEAFIDEKVLLEPLKWRPIIQHKTGDKSGARARQMYGGVARPRRIFVENQSDLFREWVTDEMLDRVFTVMALCPQHVFQVLTKRPERMLAYFAKPACFGFTWCEGYIQNAAYAISPDAHFALTNWPLPNVWLGVSVENQKAANERIPLLLQTPAAVRFISAEPLLGPVDLEHCIVERQGGGDADDEIETWWKSALDGSDIWHSDDGAVSDDPDYGKLNWVICGGESGPGARPMNPDWARSLRDQCVDAAVPFFFKQWGEWGPLAKGAGVGLNQRKNLHPWGAGASFRFGKKAAGALLDGREWREFPR